MDEIKEILHRLRSFQCGSLWPINSGLAASLGGIISDMETAIRAVETSDQNRTRDISAGLEVVA